MFCLENNVEIGSVHPFDRRHHRSQVYAAIRIHPDQFAAFETQTHGTLRRPPRVKLNSGEHQEA